MSDFSAGFLSAKARLSEHSEMNHHRASTAVWLPYTDWSINFCTDSVTDSVQLLADPIQCQALPVVEIVDVP